jgi:hypothetical protein
LTALVGLAVFETGLAVLTAAAAFLVLGSLFEPAVRASFFGAAGAFATWSSRPKAFQALLRPMSSRINPSDWVFSYYATEFVSFWTA